jgi:hypothetical protein
MVFAQRSLIDLIDVLNPNRSVFPNTDERGKLPLPSGFSEPTKARPLEHLASFYNDLGWDPFDEWVGANPLEAIKTHGCVPSHPAVGRRLCHLF